MAVTAAILIGLGFKPLQASGLSLIANTAPVAFGALGTPIIGLAGVTGYSEIVLGAQVGRILPFFSLIVPFWLVWAYAGYKGMKEIWPAVAVAGITFAIPQYLVSNYHGPWLTDIIAALASILCLISFLKFWQPKRIWGHEGHQEGEQRAARGSHGYSRGEIVRAWLPWLILSVFVFCWGTFLGKKDHEHAGKSVYLHEHLAHTAKRDYQSAVPGERPQQDGAARSSSGGEAHG